MSKEFTTYPLSEEEYKERINHALSTFPMFGLKESGEPITINAVIDYVSEQIYQCAFLSLNIGSISNNAIRNSGKNLNFYAAILRRLSDLSNPSYLDGRYNTPNGNQVYRFLIEVGLDVEKALAPKYTSFSLLHPS